MSARSRTIGLALACLAYALLGCGCRNLDGGGASGGATNVTTTERTGPAPLVTGTVLDARTGKPVAGALVRGPGGVETKTDERGRFVLRGLAPGAAGELVATTDAGLRGANLLRPLDAGALEVVVHVR